MDVVWWTLFIVAITFDTLWAAGVFKKKDGDKDGHKDHKEDTKNHEDVSKNVKRFMREGVRMRISLLLIVLLAVTASTYFSSCATTSSTTRILDWNDSLAEGQLRVILTPSPTSAVEVVRIEFHQINEMERLYVRIVDSAGHIFRLPHNIHAQWTLMGSGDESQFGLQGYNEQPQSAQPQVNVVKQRGYVEGHYLHLSVRQPKEGSSYALLVSVKLAPDLVLEKTVNIRVQIASPRK